MNIRRVIRNEMKKSGGIVKVVTIPTAKKVAMRRSLYKLDREIAASIININKPTGGIL